MLKRHTQLETHRALDEVSIRIYLTFDRTEGSWSTSAYVARLGQGSRLKLIQEGCGEPPEGNADRLADLVALTVAAWEHFHSHGEQLLLLDLLEDHDPPL